MMAEPARPVHLAPDLTAVVEQLATKRGIDFREALAQIIALGLRVSEEQARGSQILIRKREGQVVELVTTR